MPYVLGPEVKPDRRDGGGKFLARELAAILSPKLAEVLSASCWDDKFQLNKESYFEKWGKEEGAEPAEFLEWIVAATVASVAVPAKCGH